MSSKTLAQKLFIRADYTVLLLNAPQGCRETLGDLPEGVRIVARSLKLVDFILLFVNTKAQLVEVLPKTKPLLKEAGLLWVAYPKAGQLDTDLKREVVSACSELEGLETISQIAVDEVWSALRFKPDEP